MTERSDEIARKRGFVQGVAWATALIHEHPHDADGMLRESGLDLNDFVDAGVPGEDLERIKAAAKLGGVWDRKKDGKAASETMVAAARTHAKHTGLRGPGKIEKATLRGRLLSYGEVLKMAKDMPYKKDFLADLELAIRATERQIAETSSVTP